MKKTLTIRVEEEDVARWKEAAWRDRVTLSRWIRTMLHEAAESGRSMTDDIRPAPISITQDINAEHEPITAPPAQRREVTPDWKK